MQHRPCIHEWQDRDMSVSTPRERRESMLSTLTEAASFHDTKEQALACALAELVIDVVASEFATGIYAYDSDPWTHAYETAATVVNTSDFNVRLYQMLGMMADVVATYLADRTLPGDVHVLLANHAD